MNILKVFIFFSLVWIGQPQASDRLFSAVRLPCALDQAIVQKANSWLKKANFKISEESLGEIIGKLAGDDKLSAIDKEKIWEQVASKINSSGTWPEEFVSNKLVLNGDINASVYIGANYEPGRTTILVILQDGRVIGLESSEKIAKWAERLGGGRGHTLATLQVEKNKLAAALLKREIQNLLRVHLSH